MLLTKIRERPRPKTVIVNLPGLRKVERNPSPTEGDIPLVAQATKGFGLAPACCLITSSGESLTALRAGNRPNISRMYSTDPRTMSEMSS